MNTEKKVLALKHEGNGKHIVVTHLTVRQSIFFLLAKLLSIEISVACVTVVLYTLFTQVNSDLQIFNLPLYLILVIAKSFLMIYIIVRWLDEYYEITPKEIIYRKGLFFKKEEGHLLTHLSSLKIEQSLLGKMFNYGTLRLHNWINEKDVLLYLIHNPMKYSEILLSILPEADESKAVIREHVVEHEEDNAKN